MSGTRTITSTATQNKNKTKRLTHNKNKTAEAQLTDSFGEALCLGLAPRSGREQQKLHSKAAPELVGSTDQHQLGDQSNPFALHPRFGGRPQASRFVDRAFNKNKKPGRRTIRARNDLMGSFGSPCRFSLLHHAWHTAYTIPPVNARIPAHHAAILLSLADHSFKQCIPC
jgi:hypothetical protein